MNKKQLTKGLVVIAVLSGFMVFVSCNCILMDSKLQKMSIW